MTFRRGVTIAGTLLVTLIVPLAAVAQAPWPAPAQQQPAQSPWPAAPGQQAAPQAAPQPSPWDRPPQQQAAPVLSPWAQPQQPAEPPCFKQFVKLRDEAQKRAGLIQAASARSPKPTAKEACSLFNSFSAAEAKLIKYAADNAASCGIPAQVVTQMKEQHLKTTGIRTNVCRAAAAGPPRPAGPSLSDALSAPIPDSHNIRTGRGTFDTLTGSPLGR